MKRNYSICLAVLVTFVVAAVVAACGGGQGPVTESPAAQMTPTSVLNPEEETPRAENTPTEMFNPATETPTVEMTPTANITPTPPLEAAGEELVAARCTQCHGVDRVQAVGKTQMEWEHTVEHMRQHGAELTDAEAQVLVAFLAETYAP